MLKYVLLTVFLLLLVALIVLVVRGIIRAKHDNELIRQYNKEMDKIRTERLEEAKRKLREAEKKKTYYTTYND